ncbi:myelin protein zero-like protein 1 [Heptranchias perlo]|uniref:myelin protein zero-like protein 1 n=1 Tax=Heptranchias perlo TaxID=212740 RepID=UPI0035593984
MEACRAVIFLLAPVISSLSGMEIYTKSEMIVENGTDVRLSCTFKSSEIIRSSTSVTWIFKPETGGKILKIFHYSIGEAFPATQAQFQDRVIWDGNINRNDGSIIITNINFKDNGTYICDVSNPPDLNWTPGEIHLIVVEQGSIHNRTGVIVGSIFGASAVLMLIISIVYFIKKKKEGQRHGYIGTVENVSPSEQPLKTSTESDMEDSMNHSSVGPLQGPVIYAQLDHSGGKHSNKIYKSDSVVYSDIRKS